MPKPVGYEQISGLAAVQGLTPPTGDTAYTALIQAQDQSVRWRDDGTDPTAAEGMVLTANTVLEYDGDLRKFRAIEMVAGAELNVSYYGV